MKDKQKEIVNALKRTIDRNIIDKDSGFGDEEMIEALEDIADHCTVACEAKVEELGHE